MWGATVVVAAVVGLFAQLGPGAGPGHGPRLYQSNVEVKLSEPNVTNANGRVDNKMVKRYVRRHLNHYRYCYEKALLVDPSLRGSLTLQFTVRTDGKVTGVRVEGIANDVENCAAAVLRRLELPKQTEELQVRTKVMFKHVKVRAHPPGYGCGGVGCGRLG